jgi:hypothetical protein
VPFQSPRPFLTPLNGIVTDSIPDPVQFGVITNDVVVKTGLPFKNRSVFSDADRADAFVLIHNDAQ